jgi:hypothetical protein
MDPASVLNYISTFAVENKGPRFIFSKNSVSLMQTQENVYLTLFEEVGRQRNHQSWPALSSSNHLQRYQQIRIRL